MSHLIIRPANLERKYGLQILSLKHDSSTEFATQIHRRGQLRLLCNLVDSRGENETQVVGISVGKEKTLGDSREGGRRERWVNRVIFGEGPDFRGVGRLFGRIADNKTILRGHTERRRHPGSHRPAGYWSDGWMDEPKSDRPATIVEVSFLTEDGHLSVAPRN